MYRLILFIFLFSIAKWSPAQEVGSRAYGWMLDGLLDHSVPEVSVNDVQDLRSYVWLDAREEEEFNVSHIPNAIHVGYDHFDMDALHGVGKDQQILVYCSVGYRSERIAEKLRDAGYSQASNLYGGIFEWVNQGRTLVDSENNVTERVHAYNRLWGMWLKRGEKVYSGNPKK
jgi:rhodanese-related sulfurtransferase